MRNIDDIRSDYDKAIENWKSNDAIKFLYELQKAEKEIESWWGDLSWSEKGKLLEAYKTETLHIAPNSTVTPVWLPCDVGNKVYDAKWGGYEFTIEQVEKIKDGRLLFRCGNDGTDDYMAFFDDEIGKTVFLTREAAEAALKEKKE